MAARGSRRHRRHNADIGIIPVVDDGTEAEDGLGSLDAPPGAGDIEAVTDQVAARAFYHSGGDRPAGCECLVVAQVPLVAGQVAHAFLHAGPLAFRQPPLAGLRGEGAGDLLDPAGQHRQRLDGHPVFCGRIIPGVEAPGGGPQVTHLSTLSARESYVLAGRSVVAIDVTLTCR